MNRLIRAATAALFLGGALAQAAAPLDFASDKAWTTSRWYIVGQLQKSQISWIDGSVTTIPGAGSCDKSSALTRLKDPRREQELLQTQDWVAIEVSPLNSGEEFHYCDVDFKIRYKWRGFPQGVSPVLLIGPDANRYFGHTIRVQAPEESSRADIQLDMMLGYWMADFPNATGAGAQKSLAMAPMAVARGEWLLPPLPELGVALTLEQTVANFGAPVGQNALYSDWSAGLFYQRFFPLVDGLQMRAHVLYHQHFADDSTDIPTVALVNKNAKYLIGGLTSNLYFGSRWFVGFDFDYGFPGTMAGQGVKQSYLAYLGRIGARVSNSMLIFGEVGARAYKAEGIEDETVKQVQLGIRLEL